MSAVLVHGGNLETDVRTGRKPCEDWRYAATSQGTSRSWERGLERAFL